MDLTAKVVRVARSWSRRRRQGVDNDGAVRSTGWCVDLGLAGDRPLFFYFLQIPISVGRCVVTASDGERTLMVHTSVRKLARGLFSACY